MKTISEMIEGRPIPNIEGWYNAADVLPALADTVLGWVATEDRTRRGFGVGIFTYEAHGRFLGESLRYEKVFLWRPFPKEPTVEELVKAQEYWRVRT